MNFSQNTYPPLVIAFFTLSSFYIVTSDLPKPLVIPFEILENKIVIKAHVNQRIGYFIIDTGYPCLALNNQIFKGKVSQSSRHGIHSNSSQLSTTLVNLELGSLEIKRAYAEIIDLRRIVATRKVQFLGLIGAQILQDYCVIFDFKKKHLVLHSLQGGKSLQHLPELKEAQVFPLSRKGHLLCLNLVIADNSFRLALDSGAGSNLFEQDKTSNILNAIEFVDKRKLGGIGPTDVVVDRVMLHEASLDQIIYPPMATLICDLQNINRNLPGKSIDGIMGFPFFQAYRLGINFKAKQLLVWQEKKVSKQPPTPVLTTKDESNKR